MQISSTIPKATVTRPSKNPSANQNTSSRDGYIPGNWAPPIGQPKVSLFGRVSPDKAATNLRRIGQELLNGDASLAAAAKDVSKQINSAARSELLSDTSKEWMEMVAGWTDNRTGMMPLGSVEGYLKEHGGFREVSTSSVTLENGKQERKVARVSSSTQHFYHRT